MYCFIAKSLVTRLEVQPVKVIEKVKIELLYEKDSNQLGMMLEQLLTSKVDNF